MQGEGGGEREGVTAVPTLETARLYLRPFTLADAPLVQEMAGDVRVSATTLNIPHPYPEGLAREWIGTHAASAAEGRVYVFAIERKADRALLGAIATTITRQHARAEIGYWLGFSHWNQGYTTEAARRVVAFGFEELGLNRIQATYWPRNPASGRVMEKAGLIYEGTLRGYLLRKGSFEDTAIHALLRADWEKLSVHADSR
ncbi:MAG: Acetyltransferase, GNAT family [uncultured Thermomicrobiales bacterium]|uniref:Acetyltransferase, GNAT family n=1 Tax=uncultured Thermomicrobiales bacterium TaxID=1645740 RepID=A0A6J4VBQ5_9BACT|nr:MAG: Acetyltransferase, GNAT family [uncultured Thermomicrobiales bacterium]